MSNNGNQQDVQLLREQPRELIIKYQDIIQIIVKKYIASKMFHASDFEDVVQAVNEDLLSKSERIRDQYNGIALLRTYFSAIVRNSCLKIYDKKKREIKVFPLGNEDPIVEETASMNLAIEYDLERLKRIFKYYHPKKGKVILCVKLYFRLRINKEDMIACFPACSEEDTLTLLGHFGAHYENIDSKEVYQIVTPLLNKYEGKSNTIDAVRNWSEVRIREIIQLLNGNKRESSYDKESLRLLTEKYFSI
jgi:DNA-directed RNA polymerase specialized sigma24 family protein